MSALGAPVRVSPLIKFGRWSFLSVGVLYGAFHHNRLSKKETKLRTAEEEHKQVREAKLIIEKKAMAEREIKDLEALM